TMLIWAAGASGASSPPSGSSVSSSPDWASIWRCSSDESFPGPVGRPFRRRPRDGKKRDCGGQTASFPRGEGLGQRPETPVGMSRGGGVGADGHPGGSRGPSANSFGREGGSSRQKSGDSLPGSSRQGGDPAGNPRRDRSGDRRANDPV